LSDTDSYTGKTALVKEFFTKGADGCEYRRKHYFVQWVLLLSAPRDGFGTSALYPGGPGFKFMRANAFSYGLRPSYV
jgi:hypothetical protein